MTPNREQIIRMAREAGFNVGTAPQIERFASLVAAAAKAEEREACAKVCEDEGERIDASWMSCAAAIRARGQA